MTVPPSGLVNDSKEAAVWRLIDMTLVCVVRPSAQLGDGVDFLILKGPHAAGGEWVWLRAAAAINVHYR